MVSARVTGGKTEVDTRYFGTRIGFGDLLHGRGGGQGGGGVKNSFTKFLSYCFGFSFLLFPNK